LLKEFFNVSSTVFAVMFAPEALVSTAVTIQELKGYRS
jgi:hypothetical protein